MVSAAEPRGRVHASAEDAGGWILRWCAGALRDGEAGGRWPGGTNKDGGGPAAGESWAIAAAKAAAGPAGRCARVVGVALSRDLTPVGLPLRLTRGQETVRGVWRGGFRGKTAPDSRDRSTGRQRRWDLAGLRELGWEGPASLVLWRICLGTP